MSVLRKPGQTSFAFVFDLARTVDEMKHEIGTCQRKPPSRVSALQPGRALSQRRAV
jgi:hypothetical protein